MNVLNQFAVALLQTGQRPRAFMITETEDAVSTDEAPTRKEAIEVLRHFGFPSDVMNQFKTKGK